MYGYRGELEWRPAPQQPESAQEQACGASWADPTAAAAAVHLGGLSHQGSAS